MSNQDKVNRRDFIVTTASIAGAATTGATSALAQTKPPPGFDDQKPLLEYWDKRLNEVVELNKVNFDKDTRELQQEAVKERHRIYCHLLMKLMVRFWNGNKRGPFGSYPLRAAQIEPIQSSEPPQPTQRYRGDMISDPDPAVARVNWDRYLGQAPPSTPNRAWLGGCSASPTSSTAGKLDGSQASRVQRRSRRSPFIPRWNPALSARA